jgi:hypothetical protein
MPPSTSQALAEFGSWLLASRTSTVGGRALSSARTCLDAFAGQFRFGVETESAFDWWRRRPRRIDLICL